MLDLCLMPALSGERASRDIEKTFRKLTFSHEYIYWFVRGLRSTDKLTWNIKGSNSSAKRNVLIGLDKLNVAFVLGHRPLSWIKANKKYIYWPHAVVNTNRKSISTFDVRPTINPGWPKQQGNPPCDGNHQGGFICRSLGAISQRTCNGKVAIKRNDEQIKHGSVWCQVIKRQPGVANERTQRPVPQNSRHCEQRHRNQPDGQVSDCQREEEVVADCLQLLVNLERYHHLEGKSICWVVELLTRKVENLMLFRLSSSITRTTLHQDNFCWWGRMKY